MKRYYLSDHLVGLGDLPMHQKMLHLILWERADCIGFAKLNLELFSGIAGRYAFTHEDVNALDPWVKRISHDEVFLPNFLITQQCTLSKTSRGKSKVWEALQLRWKATPEDPKPYFAYMKSIGFFHLAPQIPDEYHGGEVKPKWYVDHIGRIDMALKYSEPEWPENVLIAYRALVDNYAEIARDVTSLAQSEKYRLTVNNIDNLQKQIQAMFHEKHSAEVIEQQIRSALNKNKLNVLRPWNSTK